MIREINYSKYDYAKVGHYSNVVMELPKNRSREISSETQLCSFMDALIYKVALKHPEWTFVVVDTDWHSRLERWYGYHVSVFCGTEFIGRINRDGYSEAMKYDIFNDRIDGVRTRRGGIRTKDLNKAAKTVEEFFKPKSIDERARVALREMSSHVHQTGYRVTRALNDTVTSLLPSLTAYLAANISTIRPALEALGAAAPTLDKLMQDYEKFNDVRQVRQSRDYTRGTTVVLMGDRYLLISDADTSNARLVTAAHLDPDMSRKIGVLKVFDNNEEAIEGIGMRLDATTFYLVG